MLRKVLLTVVLVALAANVAYAAEAAAEVRSFTFKQCLYDTAGNGWCSSHIYDECNATIECQEV